VSQVGREDAAKKRANRIIQVVQVTSQIMVMVIRQLTAHIILKSSCYVLVAFLCMWRFAAYGVGQDKTKLWEVIAFNHRSKSACVFVVCMNVICLCLWRKRCFLFAGQIHFSIPNL